MKETEMDMTSGSLWKKIFVFSLPLMLTNILQMMFTMADSAVAGNYAGPLAIGAIGSVSQVVFFLTGFLGGIGGAINVLAAFYIGKRSQKDLNDTIHTSTVLCFIFGTVFMIAAWFSAPSILNILQTKPELYHDALLYIRIYSLSLPFNALYVFGNAVLSAHGNTRLPLFFLTAAGIINVFLDLLLVCRFHLDVMGVAVATVSAQAISCILTLIAIYRPGFFPGTSTLKYSLKNFRISRQKSIEIIKLGIPAGAQNSVFAAANLVIQAAINNFDAWIVSGISITNNGDWLVYNIMAAFYTAGATFIGQNYGARNKIRIKNTYLITLAYSFGFGLVLGILFFIFGKPFLSLFTSDNQVVEYAMQKFKIMTFSFAISALMDGSIAANRGLGKTFVPSIFVFTGSCIFRIVWVYTVFYYFRTIESLFLLYPASWLITAIPEIIYFIRTYKKETKEMSR